MIAIHLGAQVGAAAEAGVQEGTGGMDSLHFLDYILNNFLMFEILILLQQIFGTFCLKTSIKIQVCISCQIVQESSTAQSCLPLVILLLFFIVPPLIFSFSFLFIYLCKTQIKVEFGISAPGKALLSPFFLLILKKVERNSACTHHVLKGISKNSC